MENGLGGGAGAFGHQFQDIPLNLGEVWGRSHWLFPDGSLRMIGPHGSGRGFVAAPQACWRTRHPDRTGWKARVNTVRLLFSCCGSPGIQATGSVPVQIPKVLSELIYGSEVESCQ